jgi:integrase
LPPLPPAAERSANSIPAGAARRNSNVRRNAFPFRARGCRLTKVAARNWLGTDGQPRTAVWQWNTRQTPKKWLTWQPGSKPPRYGAPKAVIHYKFQLSLSEDAFVTSHALADQTVSVLRLLARRRARDIQFDGSTLPTREIVARGAKHTAFNALSYARGLFNWALERGLVESSPCDGVKPRRLIGQRNIRQRTLSDDELRAFWRVTGRMTYPHGGLLRLLALSGVRLNEAAKATWDEFDLTRRLWTIPASRFKANAAHLVPLTNDVIALLGGLPRLPGPYVFSGRKGYGQLPGLVQRKPR